MTKTTKHLEMRNTVFGDVLAEQLEKRGLEVTPFKVGKLAEDSGFDGWAVISRMANDCREDIGRLTGLAVVASPDWPRSSTSQNPRRWSWRWPTSSRSGDCPRRQRT